VGLVKRLFRRKAAWTMTREVGVYQTELKAICALHINRCGGYYR
jgi:hypothetical protein